MCRNWTLSTVIFSFVLLCFTWFLFSCLRSSCFFCLFPPLPVTVSTVCVFSGHILSISYLQERKLSYAIWCYAIYNRGIMLKTKYTSENQQKPPLTQILYIIEVPALHTLYMRIHKIQWNVKTLNVLNAILFYFFSFSFFVLCVKEWVSVCVVRYELVFIIYFYQFSFLTVQKNLAFNKCKTEWYGLAWHGMVWYGMEWIMAFYRRRRRHRRSTYAFNETKIAWY